MPSLSITFNTTFNFFCKLAFFNGWIFLISIILSLVLTACQWRSVENMKILCLCILPLKYFYGLRLTVQGSENLNIKEPYMIVSNHQSYLDLLGMMEVLPDRCIAFALLYMGPVGLSCWCCNFIFIDRKKRSKAIETTEHIAWIMAQENLRVWVYLEGTRNPKDTMLPFKREAFHLAVKTQVSIIPIVTSSHKAVYSYKDKALKPGNWTSRILPRIETQGLGPKDVPELAENVCKTMQETFDEISSEVYGKKKVKE
ncbi:1-acyl-sn-glycerol-3-phosphate acyltransferase alpha-like [Varanus komodoensis]|uniref:1-acyl-sn-glycerol-3-phosphate acyltransferase alpha-like n=1 Tax=Varanus komodoensis TaxID=61221 RepID=UPI001CF7E762|nr:1-acyl-sn-glycerol-3-phosphate acyltransferase alpha-like [Varanus komodoensis]